MVEEHMSPAGVQDFTPSIAVSADGTVGITYSDFRNNPSVQGVPTDVWFIHSHNGGATWTEQHVAGSFDIETAPLARGYFLCDYEGVAPAGSDFLAFFVMTNTHVTNRTHVFLGRESAE